MRFYEHHEHSHGGEGVDRTLTLLSYAYDHNAHHAEELCAIAESLWAEGREEAGSLTEAAIAKFREGAALLHDALHGFHAALAPR